MAVLGICPTLDFRVAAEGGARAASAGRAERANGTGRGSGDDCAGEESRAIAEAKAARPEPTLPLFPENDEDHGARPAAREPQPRAAAASSGNGLQRKFASLAAFVSGKANVLALSAAETVARRPAQLTPLLFHGPTGVGKTHLLEGIWSAARRSPRRLTAIYLSAEQFTTYFLDALRGSGLPSFRRKYRGVDVLMLDDLQFFAGKRSTQIELLHTIDTLMREGRQLVFAADRPPHELAEFGPELTTRLQSGMVCRVEPPDHQARLEIVAQFARRMGAALPDDVIEFVAARLTNHVRALSGAVCRLQATSEALRRPITLALAAEALADLAPAGGPAVRLPDIEKAVCDVFGLQPSALRADTKGQCVSHPRMLAMWLARKHTRAALSDIGQFFGRRSHSTVVSAHKRVEGWVAEGGTLRLAQAALPVGEAIRQVERRLAAG